MKEKKREKWLTKSVTLILSNLCIVIRKRKKKSFLSVRWASASTPIANIFIDICTYVFIAHICIYKIYK